MEPRAGCRHTRRRWRLFCRGPVRRRAVRVELLLMVEQALVDGRNDGAWSDVVDRDVMRAEFDGEVAHQHSERAFARRVAVEVREDHVLVDGGDVDDAAGLLGVNEALY